ncbi:MAG TPA: phosphoribosyltransferase family protein, partial [Kofleriaceae bacterium]|nr:phosphoribosyltransferase family protein [Kofleriaceae bacterium]
MRFANRIDAGRQLADTLRAHSLVSPVVVGMSRGGVPVAAEVARELGMPLEICVVRKLQAPGLSPVTIGAIAEGGARYIDEALLAGLRVSQQELERATLREQAEVTRLSQLLRDRPAIELAGRDAILVDDGLLTGGTVRAAVRSLGMRGA